MLDSVFGLFALSLKLKFEVVNFSSLELVGDGFGLSVVVSWLLSGSFFKAILALFERVASSAGALVTSTTSSLLSVGVPWLLASVLLLL